MDASPFPYHGPLTPEQVTGRDELRRDLAQRIADRRLTALLGPRRYGKTSLLKRVAADLEAVGPESVWIDLYELTSMFDLVARVDSGLAGTVGPLRQALGSIASSMSLNLGVLSLEFSRGPRDRSDPVLALRALLDVLVRAAERSDLFVVFDEFSGISKVDGAAGVLRTGLQHHYQSLGIVFAGSEPSTMRTLFSLPQQPFFSQADLLEIGPLDDAEAHRIVADGFAATERSVGSAAGPIVAFADGHPQRVMQLADAVWRQVAPGEQADLYAWERALAEVRGSADGGFERLYSSMPVGSQKALRALACGGSVYGATAALLDLPAGTAHTAVETLTGNGTLRRQQQQLRIVDPLFADWLQTRFGSPL